MACSSGKRRDGRALYIAAIGEVPNSNLGRYPYHYHCVFHKSARAPERNMLTHKPPIAVSTSAFADRGEFRPFRQACGTFSSAISSSERSIQEGRVKVAVKDVSPNQIARLGGELRAQFQHSCREIPVSRAADRWRQVAGRQRFLAAGTDGLPWL